MRVIITYFKTSGKYYATGRYNARGTGWLEIHAEVSKLLNSGETVPGLNGDGRDFVKLVEIHDSNDRDEIVPFLVYPSRPHEVGHD